MGNNSKIEWLFGGTTWNPTAGCTPESSGCLNCYASKMATRMKNGKYQGLAAQGVWTGKLRFWPELLTEPLSWTRKPRLVFVSSMGDIFKTRHSDYVRDRIFSIIAMSNHHEKLHLNRFIVLTKRAENMQRYFSKNKINKNWSDMLIPMENGDFFQDQIKYHEGPLPNLCIGISAENNDMLIQRLPFLLQTPAVCRMISFEPLIGPIDTSVLRMHSQYCKPDWVVCGGETGPRARPIDPDWVRKIRDVCIELDIPFLFKKWGPKPIMEGVGNIQLKEDDPIRILDGRRWIQTPEWINEQKVLTEQS